MRLCLCRIFHHSETINLFNGQKDAEGPIYNLAIPHLTVLYKSSVDFFEDGNVKRTYGPWSHGGRVA